MDKKPSGLDALIASAVNEVNSSPIIVEAPPAPTYIVPEKIDTYVPKDPPPPPTPFDQSQAGENARHKMFVSFIENSSVMSLSEQEKNQINAGIQRLDSSFLNIVRTCDPVKCTIVHICPFTKIKKYPTGELCPVDKSIADFIYLEYEKYLREETSNPSGPISIIERSTLSELVECDLEDLRARSKLASEGEIVSAPAFAVNKTGVVINHDVEHPLYNVREKLGRRKQRLLQRLLLTPESKAKYHVQASDRGAKDQMELIKATEQKIKTFLLTNKDAVKSQ